MGQAHIAACLSCRNKHTECCFNKIRISQPALEGIKGCIAPRHPVKHLPDMHCTVNCRNLKDVNAAAGTQSGNTAMFVEDCRNSGDGRHMYISYPTVSSLH